MSMNSDAKLKEFWKENAHFADLYNTVLFEGKNVILPEMLQEAGTDLSMDLENLKKSRKKIASIEKYRDIFKLWKGRPFVILGIENQTKEEYVLPERILLYDILGYEAQRRRIAGKHRQKRDLKKPAEFLSGFSKTDKLSMQATIVIYYGEDPWRGPEKLSDLIDIPGKLKKYFNDYRIYVFSINESDGSEFRNPEVRKMLKAAYYLRKKKADGLEKMNAEEMKLLAAFVNSQRLATFAENMEEEEIAMCTALEEMIAEGEKRGEREGIRKGLYRGIRQGRKQGKRQGKRQGIHEMAETVIKNMRKEGATDEEIARALGWSAARVRKYKKINKALGPRP